MEAWAGQGFHPEYAVLTGCETTLQRPCFLHLQVFRAYLGAEDMLSVYQARAE